jgi:hypothetical protein
LPVQCSTRSKVWSKCPVRGHLRWCAYTQLADHRRMLDTVASAGEAAWGLHERLASNLCSLAVMETNDQTLGKGRRSFQKFPGAGSKRIVLSRYWYQIRCVSCVGRKSLASSKYAIVDLEGFCNVGIHTPLVSSTLCINCICSDTRNDARLHPCKMLQFTSHVFVIQSLNSYLL